MLRLVRAGCAALALICAGAPAAAQDLTVPKKYQALYDSLERQVTDFGKRLPADRPERTVRRAARLAAVTCAAWDAGYATRREAVALELDALKRVGAQVIVVDVCYPLLSPSFQDPRAQLEDLANLANEVRLREMGLLVDHRVLPATHPALQSRRYYDGMTRARYFAERLEEARSIVLALQPDYLTLVSQPEVTPGNFRITPGQWRAHLDRAATALQGELGDLVPPLGAGVPLWSERAYVDAFAAVPGLAYIDLRFYPLTAGGANMLDRLLEWPDRVRAVDASKRIVLSQAWLSKASADEPFREQAAPAAVAREHFGFWAPLDAQFLRTAARAARVKDVELVGISRPRLLFSYLDFFDPSTFRLSPRALEALATQRGTAAMQQGQLSEAGRAYGGM